MVVDQENVYALLAGVDTMLYGLEDDLKPIVARLSDGVHDGLDPIQDTVSAPLLRILSGVDVTLHGEEGWQPEHPELARLMDAVDTHIADATDANGAVATRILDGVDQSLSALVPGVNDIVGGVLKALSDFIGGFFASLADADDLWQALTSVIGSTLTENQQPVLDWLSAVGERIRSDVVASEFLPHEGVIHLPDTEDAPAPGGQLTVEQLIANFQSYPPLIQGIINGTLAMVNAFSVVGAMESGYISMLSQRSAALNLPSSLSASQLASLLRRGMIGEDWARDEAKRTGFSPEMFGLIFKLTQGFLTADNYVEMWRRTGDDSELDNLHKLGLSDDDISRLRTLALAIPTPSDLVRFMVRDAFDPDAIATGKLDDEFDQKVNDDWNRRVGVDKDTLRLYWMSHWTLPSPTMYYEMFHRGFITQDQLVAALKVSDYAPGWIDNLVNINYNVPGRIDVRRMYEAGIITTHEQLVKRHTDMGYSPADADTLSSFVEALHRKNQEADAERLHAPLVAEVIRSYATGGLDYPSAIESLTGLGLSSSIAEYRMQLGIFERERDHDQRVRDALHREYTRGFLSEADARSKLEGYGFETSEQDSLLDSWNIDKELSGLSDEKRHQRDLSKAEIIAAYADRIIERNEASARLQSLGYDAEESATLLALEDSKLARADAKAVESAVRSEYITRRIEAQEAGDTLRGFGYTEPRIAALMLRWSVDREERRPDISASQVERMLMQGIIDRDRVVELLKRRGYTDDDAAMLMTLYGTDVSISQQQLDEKRREFEISEARRSTQGNRRLDLTQRGQDLGQQRFTTQQTGIQERFVASQSQARDLAQARLDASAVAQNARIAAQTARDAERFAASRAQQERTLAAQTQRLDKQIEAATARQNKAISEQQATRQQRATIATQAQQSQDARQQRSLDAQAAALDKKLQAHDAAVARAADTASRLAAQRADAAQKLQDARAHIQEARDIRLNAQRIATEARTEQARVRTETRAQARKDIGTAGAAANAAALQSLQLQQSAAVADVTSRFATLTAQLADQKRQEALDARSAASQALAANTPASVLLETGF